MTVKDVLESHRTRRPVIAGILNVTPDSFSDGGKFFKPEVAVDHAMAMAEQGADVIDVGAESTRPGSERVDAAAQIERLRDVLPAIARRGAVISIDTTLADVARFALDCGAGIINDISSGRDDAGMFALAAQRGCAIILMHMLGEPKTMQKEPQYSDVLAEVREFLARRVEAAVAVGVKRANCIIDPGIGFGKRMEHNLSLLGGVDKLAELGLPVMVGASRKRFIGEITAQYDPAQRVCGTVAACLAAWYRGASIFRVHDVAEVSAAFKVATAIEQSGKTR